MDKIKFDVDSNIDEDFFSSLHINRNRRTLQQLFSDENSDDNDGKQQKFTYQGPKNQQQLNDGAANYLQTVWTTIIAKVVTNISNQQHHKVGLALLSPKKVHVNNQINKSIKNHDNCDELSCKLILYKTKKHIMESVMLRRDEQQLFKIDGCCLQFYNSTQSIWLTVKFENDIDEEEFYEKLLLYGYKIYDKTYNDGNDGDKCKVETDTIAIGSEIDDKTEVEKTHKSNAKESLINRMAKMGKPLPQLNTKSELSGIDVIEMPVENTTVPAAQPLSHQYNTSLHCNSNSMQNGTIETNSISSSTIAPQITQSPFIMPTANLENQYIPMLLSEQRTQNTELRWNINKLEGKIEKILDKLENLDKRENGKYHENHSRNEHDISKLKEKNLELENQNFDLILRFRRELRKNKEQTIQSLIQELSKEHQKLLREQNICVNSDIKEFFTALIENIKSLHDKLKVQQKKETDESLELQQQQKLKPSSHCLCNEYEVLSKESITIKEENFQLKEQQKQQLEKIDELENIVKELNLKLNALKEDNLQLNNETAQLTSELSKIKVEKDELLAQKLKAIMNCVYNEISDKLQTEFPNMQERSNLLDLLAKKFKEFTLKALQPSSL